MNESIRQFLDSLDEHWNFDREGDRNLHCGEHHINVSPSLDDTAIHFAEILWPHSADPLAAMPAMKLCEILLSDPLAFSSFSERAGPFIAHGESHTESLNGWVVTASCPSGHLQLSLQRNG